MFPLLYLSLFQDLKGHGAIMSIQSLLGFDSCSDSPCFHDLASVEEDWSGILQTVGHWDLLGGFVMVRLGFEKADHRGEVLPLHYISRGQALKETSHLYS